MSERDIVRDQITRKAVVHGRVTLSSGKEADYYVDLRRVTLHHEASRYVGQVMLALLDEAGISCAAVGGLTMGADPVGHAMFWSMLANVGVLVAVSLTTRQSPVERVQAPPDE